MPSREEINAYIAQMPALLIPEKASDLNATIQLDLTGENGGKWWLKIADSTCEITEGQAEHPTMTLTSTADDLYAVLAGDANAISAFMMGKIKVAGDMSLALKMQTMFDFDAAED